MNISQKCNCCCKESVCKFKAEYETDCKQIVVSIFGKSTEVSIKCKEFKPNDIRPKDCWRNKK